MSTQTDLLQPSPASAPPQEQEDQSPLLRDNLPDVTLRYRLESGVKHSTWIVDCGYQSAAQLDVQAGPYTLTQCNDSAHGQMKVAERLCSLPSHTAVLRVDAVTSTPTSYQIWYEPAEAGSLADYCQAKGRLPLGQVTRVARALVQGLAHLHEQGFAYSTLNAHQCVITVRGDIKLLAPDIDTRTLTPALQESKRAEDIAACASILWLCLTGEEPKIMRLRAPLNLAVPEASEALAQVLEDAIDSRAQQPQLADILAPIELAADAEPLELHLSAHPSVHARLPAYRLPEPTHYRKPAKRRRSVYGELPDLSQGKKPRSRAKLRAPIKGKPHLIYLLRERWALLGAAFIGLIALAGAGYHLLPVGEKPTPDLSATSTFLGPETDQEPTASNPVPAESMQDAIADPYQEDLGLIAAELVAFRSRVLSARETGRISDYAVSGSSLAEADRQLLSSEGVTALSEMSTEIITVHEINPIEGGYALYVTVQANGYSPVGSEQELAAQGISQQEGRVLQEVELILQREGESYLLAEARPLAIEPSAL